MSKLVIADTSCLIVLQKIGRLTILKEVFKEITITKEVADEFGDKVPNWISIVQTKDNVTKQILETELDKGEASAIALGLECVDALILIDERKGRRKAIELGLKIMGTLGVLIKAKEKGLVTSLGHEIEELKQIDFRMSEELVRNIIEKYG